MNAASQGANPAFAFNPTALAAAKAASPQSGAVPQVTVVVPYWQRFSSAAGNAAMAPLELTTALAAAIMAVLKAIIRRVAALFNYGEQQDARGPGDNPSLLANSAPDPQEMGSVMALTGNASDAPAVMKAIDSEISQLAERIKPLLSKTPKDADYMDEGGVALLVEHLGKISDYLEKAGEGLAQKERDFNEVVGVYASKLNSKGLEVGLPPQSVAAIKKMIERSPDDAEQKHLYENLMQINSEKAAIKSAKDSFVEMCVVAKSLGEDSPAYFAARRFMAKHADKGMIERIEAPSLNKFAETSPTQSISVENVGVNSVARMNPQNELDLAKTDKPAKISRSERFPSRDGDFGDSKEPVYDRQR